MKTKKLSKLVFLVLAGICFFLMTNCTKENDETPAPGPVPATINDIDGNIYHTLAIGTQVWLVENLKVTRYRNGDQIALVTGNPEWLDQSSGAFCWYNNDPSYTPVYGALYNWYAVTDSRGIAPAGWHIPTHEEWNTLTDYLGDNLTGGKMKDTLNWMPPNLNTTNSSGFTALPGGYRASNADFQRMGTLAFFWTTPEKDKKNAMLRGLSSHYDGVLLYSSNISEGYSVRCIMD
jgi:uncharacterized protein (TIGR02145 family)